MSDSEPTTWFAAPQRADPAELKSQQSRLLTLPLVVDFLDRLPDPVLVLNAQRQIVLANRPAADLLDRPAEALVGLRPGEALMCIRAHECPGGCGTSLFCRVCGAVGAILESHTKAGDAVQECHISQSLNGLSQPLDLRVWATPLAVDGAAFTLFTIRDISHEKRRLVLERLFFHDVLNAIGGLKAIVEMWPSLSGEDLREFGQLACDLVRQVIDEIESQRDLIAAERGDLVVHTREVDVPEVLTQLSILYAHHPAAAGIQLGPPRCQGPGRVVTDEVLLRRVVGNLIQNALEASTTGQVVTVGFQNERGPVITVHNEGVMPPDVQLQVFQRSFSTKEGPGRGIGSYSVKLLTERYLGGQVHFESQPGRGTTFTVELPAAGAGAETRRPPAWDQGTGAAGTTTAPGATGTTTSAG